MREEWKGMRDDERRGRWFLSEKMENGQKEEEGRETEGKKERG